MKKSINDFYNEIGEKIKFEFNYLYDEFEKRKKRDTPKEMFLWIDKELKGKSISPELNEFLTDFFFSIH